MGWFADLVDDDAQALFIGIGRDVDSGGKSTRSASPTASRRSPGHTCPTGRRDDPATTAAGTGAFEEGHLQTGEALEDAAHGEHREGGHILDRVANRMRNREIRRVADEAQANVFFQGRVPVGGTEPGRPGAHIPPRGGRRTGSPRTAVDRVGNAHDRDRPPVRSRPGAPPRPPVPRRGTALGGELQPLRIGPDVIVGPIVVGPAERGRGAEPTQSRRSSARDLPATGGVEDPDVDAFDVHRLEMRIPGRSLVPRRARNGYCGRPYRRSKSFRVRAAAESRDIGRNRLALNDHLMSLSGTSGGKRGLWLKCGACGFHSSSR